ncbi:copper homeostasis protein CutC [Nocardioides flavescens]|uniref:Copper homeostasis protein CutC n=1 Tax=Nocardioides flavescens TaxID=2691959 RepID=A0A6L7F2Y6_9ACTN|nr:copper homeostasis protein CutC [Nocardioides flavescens]MXG90414.1 copper homeostasis protein CutC [Nocardioides flavescens]
MRLLLEVTVTQERDVPGALEGGADRLLTTATETAVVSATCREAGDVPVFVAVDSLETARPLLDVGAAGVAVGFLDEDLEVDVAACASLAEVPWLFTALDDTLDPRRSWRRLVGPPRLPGLVGVRSAGDPRGMGEGYDALLATAESDPAVAALLVPAGGLLAEHVPWLVRTGVRAFAVDAQVRPGGSARAYVAADLVRSWRLLLDAAGERL